MYVNHISPQLSPSYHPWDLFTYFLPVSMSFLKIILKIVIVVVVVVVVVVIVVFQVQLVLTTCMGNIFANNNNDDDDSLLSPISRAMSPEKTGFLACPWVTILSSNSSSRGGGPMSPWPTMLEFWLA